MSDEIPTAEVVEEPGRHRFVLETGGEVAELVYREQPGRIDLVHTGVPTALEGHGLGGQLVRAAVAKAAAAGTTVVPSCPFVRSWLERHPDVAATVEIDW